MEPVFSLKHLYLLVYPEDGGSRFLQNVGIYQTSGRHISEYFNSKIVRTKRISITDKIYHSFLLGLKVDLPSGLHLLITVVVLSIY
jgi:hypothetical protein